MRSSHILLYKSKRQSRRKKIQSRIRKSRRQSRRQMKGKSRRQSRRKSRGKTRKRQIRKSRRQMSKYKLSGGGDDDDSQRKADLIKQISSKTPQEFDLDLEGMKMSDLQDRLNILKLFNRYCQSYPSRGMSLEKKKIVMAGIIVLYNDFKTKLSFDEIYAAVFAVTQPQLRRIVRSIPVHAIMDKIRTFLDKRVDKLAASEQLLALASSQNERLGENSHLRGVNNLEDIFHEVAKKVSKD